jgi:hypothetical protein
VSRRATLSILLTLIVCLLAGCKPDFAVSAESLYSEFNSDPNAFEIKYKNKLVEITGVIDAIVQDFPESLHLNSILIALVCGNESADETDDEVSDIQVWLPDSAADTVAKLNKGDTITVQGRLASMHTDSWLRFVSFEDGKIVATGK